MKSILLAIVVVLSSIAAVLASPIQSSDNPEPSQAVPSSWRLELVEPFGGSTPPEIALSSADLPRIAYYPPGRVQYAVRNETAWTIETVATSVWGGASVYFALGPSDEPHLLYNGYPGTHGGLNGVYYAVKRGSNWTFLSRPCGGADIVVDPLGSPQIACWGKTADGSRYALGYHILSGMNWTTEYVDTWTAISGSAWISLKLDQNQSPRILYYNGIDGNVRYAFRDGLGWHVEVVESIGNIQYIGKHGSLAIGMDRVPRATYWADVDYNLNKASLHYAFRSSSGWSIQTVEGPPGMKGRFPNIGVDPSGIIHITDIDWDILNPANYSFLADLRYGTLSAGIWTWETIIAGYQFINGSYYQVRLPDFPSMALDSCGNPHIAFYYNVIEGNDMSRRGVYYATKGPPCSTNRPPTANAGGPYVGYESTPLTLDASASSDPDNDSLIYQWDFDNDGIADTPWSSSPSTNNTWGDDYSGTVRIEVSDGNLTSNATAVVTILNLPPRIASITATVNATATLRIAGEKWHDVSAYQTAGGNETLLATLTRQPGKPQETSFGIGIDVTTNNSLRIVYTPEDDKVNGQPNGATPAWLDVSFDSGPPVSIHHTFNVKHPETWNWTVGLNSLLAGRSPTFTATATDPGSDDLTFTWDWGDGIPATTTTYFNDGIGPDLYPSPGGTFPFTATDTELYTYVVAGIYTLDLKVSDDDGGSATSTMTIQVG